MLQLREVNTYYEKSHVLFDLSLDVKQREIVALVGRNGVGKTTTIKTIMGLIPNIMGSIRYCGEEIIGNKSHRISLAGIGLVPEERWIFPSLTVHQNLVMGIKPGHYKKNVTQGWTIDRCYDHFQFLEERCNQKGGLLSGGEMQILAIVRALLGNPQLILIDEPTEGLAPMIVEQVSNIIREINESGTTILLVEQQLPIVLGLAHRIYLMSKGTIQWEGTPEELQERDDIRKMYLEVS